MSHHEHDQNDTEQREALAKLIGKFRTVMFVSRNAEGLLVSRPMSPLGDDFDGTLWFATERNNAVIEEIAADAQVNVAFCDQGDSNYVSTAGKAVQVDDRAKIEELWTPALKVFFEDKDDPNLTLIRVDVKTAEYWDSPGSMLGKLAYFVTAAATGDHTAMTDRGSVDLR